MALWGKNNNEQESNHPLVVETKTNHSVMANTVNVNDVNRIAAGAKFTGDIATVNDIRIDGSFEGRLYSESRVVVGEKAVVKGDIFATYIDFNGSMLGGNFYVKDTLSLKGGCVVDGDLHIKRLQVELDAKFNGNCKMIGEADFEKIAAQLSGHPQPQQAAPAAGIPQPQK